jgi:hypothetical protein
VPHNVVGAPEVVVHHAPTLGEGHGGFVIEQISRNGNAMKVSLWWDAYNGMRRTEGCFGVLNILHTTVV